MAFPVVAVDETALLDAIRSQADRPDFGEVVVSGPCQGHNFPKL